MFSRLEIRPSNLPGILSALISAGEQEFDDVVPQFLDHQIGYSFHNASCTRDHPDQLWFLNGPALVDAGAKDTDDLNAVSHICFLGDNVISVLHVSFITKRLYYAHR